MRRPGYQNLQSRYLYGITESSFVGIAESYAESLKRINTENHWGLLTRRKNIGRRGGGKNLSESLSEQELALFKKVNEKDLELYRKARQSFDAFGISPPGRRGLLSVFARHYARKGKS